MWSSASPRCWAAATAISSRSLTFAWPVKSEKRDGRNVSSSATSGLFKVEIGRSAIGQTMRKPAESDKTESRAMLRACALHIPATPGHFPVDPWVEFQELNVDLTDV